MTTLNRIRRIYSAWGRHPRVYAAQDPITFLGRHRQIRRRAVQAMGVGPGARVLEVACGTGRNFPYIEQEIGPRGELVGVDYSPEMLDGARAQATRSGWSNVELIRADASQLEIPGEPFDGAISVLGMSVIPDINGALQRIRELLRPGAVLSVCDAQLFPDRFAWLNPLLRPVFTNLAGWDPDRDVPAAIREVFGQVELETHNAGTFFIARAAKPASSGPP